MSTLTTRVAFNVELIHELVRVLVQGSRQLRRGRRAAMTPVDDLVYYSPAPDAVLLALALWLPAHAAQRRSP